MEKNNKNLLNDLLDKLVSSNHPSTDELLLQISLILEKNSLYASKEDFYQKLMPENLLSVRLSSEDILQILDTLKKLVKERKIPSTTLIAARGLRLEETLIEFILENISANLEIMDITEVVENLNALDHFVYPEFTKSHSFLSKQIISILKLLISSEFVKNQEMERFSDNILKKLTD